MKKFPVLINSVTTADSSFKSDHAANSIIFAVVGQTKCIGGSGRREDFPSVVRVRWNSPANHLDLSNPIEPMLENWPITGHLSSPGIGFVCSYNSLKTNKQKNRTRENPVICFAYYSHFPSNHLHFAENYLFYKYYNPTF